MVKYIARDIFSLKGRRKYLHIVDNYYGPRESATGEKEVWLTKYSEKY